MKKLALVSLAVMSLSSSLATANEQSEQNETHRVGAQLSAGAASYYNSSNNGNGIAQVYLYYDYQFDKTWALELGMNGASSGDEACKGINAKYNCQNTELFFNRSIDKVEFSNFVIAAKGQFKITENNSLYGKVGGQSYNYSMFEKGRKTADISGFGLFLESGWQYDWDNGLAMNVALQYIDMDELYTSSLGAGISYRF